jgi:uncharacterized protein (UPF0335 family)
MTNSDLRDRAEKIIALMDQADDLKTEIADRFADAKNAGFTVSALRKAIKVARMDGDKRKKHEAEQMDLEMYLAELEGRRIETARTSTEAMLAYLEQSRKIREAAE